MGDTQGLPSTKLWSAPVDLENLTVEELEQLSKDAAAAAKKKREEARKELRRKLEALIREAGFTFHDIFPEVDPSELKRSLPIMYRHPDMPKFTWTGQGRRPKWLVHELNNGADLDSFKIR
jgi:DNA-binding protein H-NS